MRTINNIILISMIALAFCFTSCSSDDGGEQPMPIPSDSELSIGEEPIMIKIGEENKVELEILQGNGDYNVFSTNENIAKTEITDAKIMIEGIKMGNAYIVVSDKSGYYVKRPVSVYITDVLELEETELAFEAGIGKPASATTKITNGNGGYKVVSDNRKVSVSITQEGVITVSGAAEDADTEITATITVTDALSLTASLKVRIIPTTNPYTQVEMNEILADDTRRYFLDDVDQVDWTWSVTFENKVDNGKITYGWNYYSYNHLITFNGDKSKGKKTNALFNCYNYAGRKFITYVNQSITLEIANNDGTNIWAVYSFTDQSGVSHRGYFCDTIEP